MGKKWDKERNDETGIVWRNVKEPRMTVEAHFEDEAYSDDPNPFWYAFTGKDGKGMERSPYISETKKDVIAMVAQLKKTFERSREVR